MKHLKLLTIIILALSIAACGAAPTAATEATPIPTVLADDTIISEGRIEPIHYTELALNANGLISEVPMEEGGTVAAGDLIARLQSNEAKTLETAQADAAKELTEAYQEFSTARIKVDNFDTPSKFDGMTPTQAVAAMLVTLNEERVNFEPYQHLDAKKLEFTNEEEKGYRAVEGIAKIRKRALDNAWAFYRLSIQWMELETNLQNAEARVAVAQHNYDALQDPSFSADTAGTRAALANAEVRAPFAGTITNLDLKVGEFEASGQPVVTIADTSNWIVKTSDLTEIDVVNIKEGQPVTIKLDAIPGVELKGHVLSIGENYTINQGDVVYEVIILLTDKDAAMRWGMTAVVTFE